MSVSNGRLNARQLRQALVQSEAEHLRDAQKIDLLEAQQRTDRETIAELQSHGLKTIGALADMEIERNDLRSTVTILETRLEEAKRALMPFAGKSVFFPDDPNQLVDVGCRIKDLRRIEATVLAWPETPKWLECVREVLEFHREYRRLTEGMSVAAAEQRPKILAALDRLAEAMKGEK